MSPPFQRPITSPAATQPSLTVLASTRSASRQKSTGAERPRAAQQACGSVAAWLPASDRCPLAALDHTHAPARFPFRERQKPFSQHSANVCMVSQRQLHWPGPRHRQTRDQRESMPARTASRPHRTLGPPSRSKSPRGWEGVGGPWAVGPMAPCARGGVHPSPEGENQRESALAASRPRRPCVFQTECCRGVTAIRMCLWPAAPWIARGNLCAE
jgi:hypothetical protein